MGQRVIVLGSRKYKKYKKNLSGESTRPLATAPPLDLVEKKNGYNFKNKLKNVLSLVDNPLPPPLLVNCPLKKRTLLRLPL